MRQSGIVVPEPHASVPEALALANNKAIFGGVVVHRPTDKIRNRLSFAILRPLARPSTISCLASSTVPQPGS